MSNSENIKLAYGIGCIRTMTQAGVDPAAFVKQASVSGNPDLLKMAEAVASVYNYNEQAPQYVEKIAAITKEAAGGRLSNIAEGAEGMWDAASGIPGHLAAGFRGGRAGVEGRHVGGATELQRALAQAGNLAGRHPGVAAGLGAGALGTGAAMGAGGVMGGQAMMQEDPWYVRAGDALGMG